MKDKKVKVRIHVNDEIRIIPRELLNVKHMDFIEFVEEKAKRKPGRPKKK